MIQEGGAGAPATERGRRTARSLREAARDVFSDLGYAGARVEDIVAEAGVSHGTFYTYYDNKAAVLDALVDETETALLEIVDEPWEGPNAPATVESVIARFVEVFSEYADVVRTWIEATAHEDHFRARLRDVRTGYTERVAAQLEPVLQGTEHDPRVVAAALIALVEGYATQGLAVSGQVERERAVRTLTAIWVGGVRELATTS